MKIEWEFTKPGGEEGLEKAWRHERTWAVLPQAKRLVFGKRRWLMLVQEAGPGSKRL